MKHHPAQRGATTTKQLNKHATGRRHARVDRNVLGLVAGLAVASTAPFLHRQEPDARYRTATNRWATSELNAAGHNRETLAAILATDPSVAAAEIYESSIDAELQLRHGAYRSARDSAAAQAAMQTLPTAGQGDCTWRHSATVSTLSRLDSEGSFLIVHWERSTSAWMLGWIVGGLAAAGWSAFRLAGRRRARPTESPDAANEPMQDQAALREQAFATLAHELRNPLTTILASIEMLRDGYAEDPADSETLMEQANAAGHHLLFLVNDLLDSSAHEVGRLRIDVEPMWLDDLLMRIQHIMLPTAELRSTTLTVEGIGSPLRMVVDGNRFLQVAFNLISNAVKYSGAGTTVRLSTRHISADGTLLFEVEDEGIGVPEDKRTDLFQRYSRVHGEQDSRASGTGLGLYMCKLLVEAMGGSIGYRAAKTNGSVFWFRLPVEASSSAQQVAACTPTANSGL